MLSLLIKNGINFNKKSYISDYLWKNSELRRNILFFCFKDKFKAVFHQV